MKKDKQFKSISNNEFYSEFIKLKDTFLTNHECIIKKLDDIKLNLNNHLAHHEQSEKDYNKNFKLLALIISIFSILVSIIIKFAWR